MEIKRKSWLLNVLLLIEVLPLLALGNKVQTNPSVQILQPSSEAQSLGNFAEIPVDLYTGRTNIDIPLFTITHNGIEVPVSLSYHGGGIKVDDECGFVGLGWTLNAGGVVNRIVRGMPDELYEPNKIAGYNRLNDLTISSNYNQFHSFISAMENKPKDVDNTALISNPTPDEKTLLKWMQDYGILYDEGHFDTSPDNFIFSVQGLYGAFVNGKHSQKQSNIGCVISKIPDGYCIQDINGLTYSFRKTEKQYYPYKVSTNLWLEEWDNLEQDKFLYTSAWWLTSIKSLAEDSVIFRYQTIKKRHRTPNTYAYTQYKYIGEGKQEEYDCNFISPHNYFMDTVHHQHTLLSEIWTPNSRLVFHYSENSSRAEFACLVDSISMYALTEESGNMHEALIERYKFTYSGISSRAKLIRLTRQGKNGSTQRYDFTYRSSKTPDEDEKDHWGYYAKGSKGTFPYMPYLNIVPQKLPRDRSCSRHANNSSADNNMLTSIRYPSGLRVNLTWEPHDFSKWSKVGESAYKEYAYNAAPQLIYDTIICNQFELCGKLNQEYLSQKIYLNTNNYIDLDISQYFYDSNVWNRMDCVMDWDTNYPDSERPCFSILRDGQEIYFSYLDSVSILRTIANKNEINDLVYNNGSGYYTFLLSNPRTTLRGATSDLCGVYHDMFNKSETNLGKIFITIFEKTAKEVPTAECHVGGVRIKSIEYFDNNKLLLRKEYSYTDSTGRSSGVLSYPPRYASAHQVCITSFEDGGQGGADAVDNNDPYALFLRSNGLPYALNSGGHMEYEQVTEVITSKQPSGMSYNPMNRIEYYYQTSADEGFSDIDDTNYYTFIPSDMLQLTSKKHQRGHLWKKVEYTDERKITEYNYKVLEKPDTVFFTGALFPIADFRQFKFDDANIKPYKNFGIVRYRVIPYNKRLTSQKTIGDKTNTYDSYTYANNTYSQALNADMPLTHTYVTSEGDTLVDHFTYEDNTNKIKQCITTKNGYVVDGYKLEYDSALRVIEKYAPILSSTSLPTDSIWELQETYKYNDSINKICEIVNHQTNITTTYLWSYRGLYPIAEIINATLEEVKNLITIGVIQNLQETYSPNMNIVNNLRTLLPHANVNTMTYEPFVGMTSYTDAKGYTQYYRYDDFGQLRETYEIVGEKDKVLKHFEYQIRNR